ncbi:DUF4383 domain-containing protein [Oscillatoria sp. FACHB-1407]|uniref:DUF4383 domain-containing protein n=1 Tax=Oscillatoria sp. FACHB-1407 TaxID=2692847 RepID=UPI001682FAAB|nr:DUF4383 domain-containing protein [Oscillatoria sp. FACHB-1407]MBD2459560.1 DUF4383 domain-containing protein [Oscillatoria sp. FACHB-1407]
MKPGQYFALIIGIMYVLVGVSGFIPGLVTPPVADPDSVNLSFTTGYGYLMGLFPINFLHNIIHLSVGLAGIFASISLGSARLFSGGLALFYGALVLFGLFPPTQSTFGLIPIFGNDIWLHAITAAIATYFGFIATPDLAELREDNASKQATSIR